LDCDGVCGGSADGTEVPSPKVACGGQEYGGCMGTPCVNANASYPVRCCADTNLEGNWSYNSACDVWAASEVDNGECNFAATFEEATEICTSVGARLCTLEEMQSGCTSGSGCGIDSYMVWTSTLCASDEVCCGDETMDCHGVCGGQGVLDQCGVCDGDGSSCCYSHNFSHYLNDGKCFGSPEGCSAVGGAWGWHGKFCSGGQFIAGCDGGGNGCEMCQ